MAQFQRRGRHIHLDIGQIKMTDDLGRPYIDFQTLDACPHCKRNQMIYLKRHAYPTDSFSHIPHVTYSTWECPDCGVIYDEVEDLDGTAYDLQGNPL